MKEWFKKAFTAKNIIIGICVPTVLAIGYYAYVGLDRKSKHKKLIDILDKSFDSVPSEHTINQPVSMRGVIMTEWDVELKKLSEKSFNAFYNYAIITLPLGKDKESNKWAYEVTSPDDYNKRLKVMTSLNDELTKTTKVMEYFDQIAEKLK